MFSFRKIVASHFALQIFIALSNHNTEAHGFGINLIKVPDDDIEQVVCSMALLRKYYNSGESLSGSVLYMSLTTASMHTQKKLLEAIHKLDDDFPWTIVIRHPKKSKLMGAGGGGGWDSSNAAIVLHEKPQCYFVVIENLENEDLEDIFEDWKTTSNWNPLAQFVVYLSSVEETDEEMTELMIEILLSFMSKKIFNVNVIGQNEESGYYYGKTAFPYHPDNNCGNRVISIEILDVCDFHIGERKEPATDDGFEENGNDGGGDGDGGDEYAADEDGGKMGTDENYGEDKSFEGRKNDNGKGGEDVEEGSSKETGANDENAAHDESYDGEENKSNEAGKGNGSGVGSTTDEGENESQNDRVGAAENGADSGLNDGNEERNGENPSTNEANDYTDQGLSKENYERRELKYSGRIQKNRERPYENQKKKVNIKRKINPKKSSRNLKRVQRSAIKPYPIAAFIRKVNRYFSQPKLSSSFGGTQSFMHLETDSNRLDPSSVENSSTSIDENDNDVEPHFFFEEIFRALFLDKFPRDLSGCPLAAAYRPWEPYIFTERSDYSPTQDYSDDENNTAGAIKSKSGLAGDSLVYDENGQHFQFDGLSEYATEEANSNEDSRVKTLSGIEYQLLKTIAECLHININFQGENSNLYHLFQDLIDGDIEMLIGGIDEDPSMSQYVSATIPYHQDDLTWCVAKARRSHSLFNFMASFSGAVWLAISCFKLYASLIVTWLQVFLKIPEANRTGFLNSYFRVFGNIFSQSMPMSQRRRPWRLLFCFSFFLGFMFMNAYQSFLISTLTTPESAYQIKSIAEIYQHRMIIKGSVDNVRHLNKDGPIYKYIRENFQMCYNIEECLIEAAENENVAIAVAVSRQHSFYNPRIPRNRLYCFDRNENIYIYLVTMLLPKKFHLLHKINPVIQYVIESGHMQKWARDLDMRRQIRDERKNRAHEDKYRSLTLDQVIGSFYFSLFLLLCAFIVLGLEMCSYHLATAKRYRRRLKIAKFLHRQFLRA